MKGNRELKWNKPNQQYIMSQEHVI